MSRGSNKRRLFKLSFLTRPEDLDIIEYREIKNTFKPSVDLINKFYLGLYTHKYGNNALIPEFDDVLSEASEATLKVVIDSLIPFKEARWDIITNILYKSRFDESLLKFIEISFNANYPVSVGHPDYLSFKDHYMFFKRQKNIDRILEMG